MDPRIKVLDELKSILKPFKDLKNTEENRQKLKKVLEDVLTIFMMQGHRHLPKIVILQMSNNNLEVTLLRPNDVAFKDDDDFYEFLKTGK